MLFLIVGYDELSEEESGDISELVEGQLFPNSTFVITSRRGSSKPIPSVLHRRLLIAGLSPDQTHRFISRYFEAINKPGSGNEVRLGMGQVLYVWCIRLVQWEIWQVKCNAAVLHFSLYMITTLIIMHSIYNLSTKFSLICIAVHLFIITKFLTISSSRE